MTSTSIPSSTSTTLSDYTSEADFELQPTQLPNNCIKTFYEGSNLDYEIPKNLHNVQYLYENGIIHWPNFTVLETINKCFPNCGLCTSHSGDSTYYIFNILVIGTFLPLIGFCGLIGNSLSAFIYSRPTMRKHSTNLYLCALGCSDNSVILTALFLFFIESIKKHSATLSVLYGRLSPYIYPAGMMAQACSVYFTLIAGFDCFVQVCLTKKLRKCCGSKACIRSAIFGILLFSVLYNAPHLFEAILVDCWHPQFRTFSVDVCPAPFRFNPTYMTIYYKYMYSIFLAVGPLILLIVLNSCIILVTIYKSKRKKLESQNTPSHYEKTNRNCYNSANQKIYDETLKTKLLEFTSTNVINNNNNNINFNNNNNVVQSAITEQSISSPEDNIALILVVLLFICCNIIALLINVFETKLSTVLEWRINYIIDISNLLVVLNSSVNIVIYYNFSNSFRKTFRKQFCRKKKKVLEETNLTEPVNEFHKQNGKKIGDLQQHYNRHTIKTMKTSYMVTASGNESEDDIETMHTIKNNCTGEKVQECSKCACHFQSYHPQRSLSSRSQSFNYKFPCTKPTLLTVLRVNNGSNVVINNNHTDSEKKGIKNSNERSSKRKILVPPLILSSEIKSINYLNSPETTDSLSLLPQQSPHSIILFQDYGEQIEEYMDSCAELVNSPQPHGNGGFTASFPSENRSSENHTNSFDKIVSKTSSLDSKNSAMFTTFFG